MKAPLIELNQVSKIYELGDEKLYALNHITTTIYTDDFLAIVGPSGCGKSTLMHLASLLDNPTEGEITIKGIKTGSYSEKQRSKLRNQYIGFIFQQFNLLAKTSSLENVALPLLYANIGKRERHKRAQEMLEKVGLGDRLKNTPAQLSGGQQQRVAIARALINNPEIIFADEPTGNLDSHSGSEIKKLLVSLHKEGRTVVMVTHDKDLANIAMRRLSLIDGKISKDSR
jgi:putative ABC transport system ATP-binding protein